MGAEGTRVRCETGSGRETRTTERCAGVSGDVLREYLVLFLYSFAAGRGVREGGGQDGVESEETAEKQWRQRAQRRHGYYSLLPCMAQECRGAVVVCFDRVF